MTGHCLLTLGHCLSILDVIRLRHVPGLLTTDSVTLHVCGPSTTSKTQQLSSRLMLERVSVGQRRMPAVSLVPPLNRLSASGRSQSSVWCKFIFSFPLTLLPSVPQPGLRVRIGAWRHTHNQRLRIKCTAGLCSVFIILI